MFLMPLFLRHASQAPQTCFPHQEECVAMRRQRASQIPWYHSLSLSPLSLAPSSPCLPSVWAGRTGTDVITYRAGSSKGKTSQTVCLSLTTRFWFILRREMYCYGRQDHNRPKTSYLRVHVFPACISMLGWVYHRWSVWERPCGSFPQFNTI